MSLVTMAVVCLHLVHEEKDWVIVVEKRSENVVTTKMVANQLEARPNLVALSGYAQSVHHFNQQPHQK
jgi:hypothetical protein